MDDWTIPTPVAVDRPRVESRLRAIVNRLIPGARIYFSRHPDRRIRYSWNGRHLRPTGLTLESQCHEVAHLLVAARERHALPELGLGPDPYRHSDAPCVLPPTEAMREELDACAMQLVLVRLLHLDEHAVVDEVRIDPLTPARIETLRAMYPTVLPEHLWNEVMALSTLRQSPG